MNEQEVNKEDGSEDSKLHSNCEEECVENYIEIFVNSIENIIRDGALVLKLVAEHNGVTLGESKLIKINSNYENISNEYVIEFSSILPYSAQDVESIRSIASTPAIITAFEVTDEGSGSTQNYDSKIDAKNPDKKSLSPSISGTKILGLCNIDLLPIALGEEGYEEKIVLEVPSYDWDGKAVSWTNLPRLSVSVSRNDSSYSQSECDCFNLLSITVESIYNLPEDFKEDTEYKCGTVLFSENLQSEESYLVFDAGKWTDYKDLEKTKTWKPLEHLNSRAKFSKYSLDSNYDKVINCFKDQFDLKSAANSNLARIEWNCMHRTAISVKGMEKIKEQLKKYKQWPFEVMLTEKSTNPKGIVEDSTTIYQCFADVSQLLYPGKTKTRILTQLYTKSASRMEHETGLPISIFEFLRKREEAEVKEHSKTDDSISSQSFHAEFTPCYPLYSDTGKPVLILLEFELWQPFLKARVLEDYTEALERLKQIPKPKTPLFVFTPDLAQDKYIDCIQQLTDVICEDYIDFSRRCERENDFEKKMLIKSKAGDNNSCERDSSCSLETEDNVTCPYGYIPDEMGRFKQYLHESGKYTSIRTTLKKSIVNVLDQKFALNYSNWYSQENQNLIASCYTYLVDEMHHALNTKLDVRLSAEYSKFKEDDGYWYRSEEAYEYEDYDKTESLLSKIVMANRKDPNSWILYAIYFMRRSGVDEALECCREAIKLDKRHKIGLLFYGILLAVKENYTDAEIFLKAVTHFYPRYTEAWTILHIFYTKIQYGPGIDLTLQVAEQCIKDRVREEEPKGVIFQEEPMAWSTLPCQPSNAFNITAVLLLKLNLYKFAGLTIMRESVTDKCESVVSLYFLSVTQYLQGSYKDAIENLEKAQQIIGIDFSITSLLAHCLYKVGNSCKAAELYEAADGLYERPENIHLVHMRLGFHYIDIEEYEKARCVFLRACKYPPTCKTWLGVGISCYHLKNFKDCELALMEANRIDDEDPEVWGYLCLLSMELDRYPEFTQCYRQTVKNNLKREKIWELITCKMDSLGYSPPVTVLEDFNVRCTC